MKLKVKSYKISKTKNTKHSSVHILFKQQSVNVLSPFGVHSSTDVLMCHHAANDLAYFCFGLA